MCVIYSWQLSKMNHSANRYLASVFIFDSKVKQPKRTKEDFIMPIAGTCPYFQREKGDGYTYCECARFRFPDKQARRDIVYQYCAHPDGYRACVIKQTMDQFYERKYNGGETTKHKIAG